MSDLEQIDHYVLMVSQHNIAEFRECIFLQPKNIYLITTSKMLKPAERLEKQLKEKLSASSIHILQKDDFKGINSAEINNWIEKEFLPITQQWESKNAILNMTGGTKILSSLLLQCYDWQEVHYVPHNSENKSLEIECFTIENSILSYKQPIEINDILPPITAIALYADNIKSIDENLCRKSDDSLKLAMMRLEAQMMDDVSSDNPFSAITPILNKIWHSDNTTKEKEELITWQTFNLDKNIIKSFFERLDNLNNKSILKYTNDGIYIPTKRHSNKAVKNWIKWIEGDWFEQLVYHWLIEIGISKNAIATSVDIKRNTDDNSGETDLLLFYNQNVCFLETKADKNPTQSFADFERQLTSQAQDLGLVQKYLVLTPIIKKQAKLEQWEAFERLCQSRRVGIIIAENAQSFKAYFNN